MTCCHNDVDLLLNNSSLVSASDFQRIRYRSRNSLTNTFRLYGLILNAACQETSTRLSIETLTLIQTCRLVQTWQSFISQDSWYGKDWANMAENAHPLNTQDFVCVSSSLIQTFSLSFSSSLGQEMCCLA